MGRNEYTNKIFKVDEVGQPLGLAGLLGSHKVVVTYNQLMKSDSAPRYLFIFDEKGAEVPSLIMYCRHFGVELLKIGSGEAAEVQSVIKHARLIGVPGGSAISNVLSTRLEGIRRSCIPIDILKIKNMKI